MPKVYAIDGIVPVVDPSAFVHPSAVLIGDVIVGPRAYVGPAAIVNAHRFIFDSRDAAHAERLELMADADGVWRCRTVFNCVEACPRGINVTRAILEVTQAIEDRPA